MKRIILLTAIVGIALLLAGCAEPTGNVSDAVNESTAVEDVSYDLDAVSLTLHDDVQQNNQQCQTTYNPATGTSVTTCYDNWHSATITDVRVEDGDGNHIDTIRGDSLNGETVIANIHQDGEYYFHLQSNQGTTVFSIEIEGDKLVGAGYSNTY